MKKLFNATLLAFGLISVSFSSQATEISKQAMRTADYAVATYSQDMIDALAKMVSFKTVADPNIPYEKNPHFIGYKQYVKTLSKELGLIYEDHGYIMLVSLDQTLNGEHKQRVGIVTHGDVQPADPAKWQQSPFSLDTKSKPGYLVARGTEDDKGAIATAMYAMKAVKDKNIALDRKIELIIYMAEESNWGPFQEFLKTWQAPDINLTIDSDYPVVTAEKGWSMIKAIVPAQKPFTDSNKPFISEFYGGSFGSQIPEDAFAVINNADSKLLKTIKNKADAHKQVKFTFALNESVLSIKAKGKSAHSSTPQYGVNAVAFLADALKGMTWPKTSASLAVNYINDLVGTGLNAEKFGDIAYSDDFMGPMTLAPTVLKMTEKGGVDINLNLRRPVGKTTRLLKQQTHTALDAWQAKHEVKLENLQLYFGEPLVVNDAPHVKPLLAIFSHFTGIKDPQPKSIGGSTNAKLLPNAVSFGPSMPDAEYTGHSEHEYISVKQIKLNLAMYTAMMIELGRD